MGEFFAGQLGGFEVICGVFPEPVDAEEFFAAVGDATDREPQVFEGHRRMIASVGIVTGEAILGANIFKDLFASIRDIVGGRSAAYEQELRKARQIAIDEMAFEAEEWERLS